MRNVILKQRYKNLQSFLKEQKKYYAGMDIGEILFLMRCEMGVFLSELWCIRCHLYFYVKSDAQGRSFSGR